MPCSNTGRDVSEALIPSPVPFPISVGEPPQLPVQLETCSVGFVVASAGAPLQRTEIMSFALEVCSFGNLTVQKISPL